MGKEHFIDISPEFLGKFLTCGLEKKDLIQRHPFYRKQPENEVLLWPLLEMKGLGLLAVSFLVIRAV